jgi:hypothetical protein
MRLLLDAVAAAPDWSWVQSAGSGAILGGVVLSLIKGWLVPGKQYEEVCAQRDKALEQVYKLAASAARAIEAVERKIGP